MSDLTITDVRSFVPAKDFELSRAFYVALGWRLMWDDGNLAILENGAHRFYLQNHYVKEWAENCMLHVSVLDASAWNAHVTSLVDSGSFPGVRVGNLTQESYGALVTHVWDPAGVLLHFAQWNHA